MSNELLTTTQAVEYINQRLPEHERWNSGHQTLYYHRKAGHIASEPATGGDGRALHLYRPSELDRFLKTLSGPGPRPVNVAAIEKRLGRETDKALAGQAGVWPGVVRRARLARGIPENPYRKPRHRAAFEAALALLREGLNALEVASSLDPNIPRWKRKRIAASAARALKMRDK